jgi:hypothetical protein
MPVRKILRNYRNITGISPHKKSIGIANYESSLERDFLTFLQFRPDIDRFEVQPVRIEWHDDTNRTHHYTPDVIVTFKKTTGRHPLLCEVKYRSELIEKWDFLQPKFEAARLYSIRNNVSFRIVSDGFIHSAFVQNAKFLLPFVDKGSYTEEYIDLINGRISEINRTTISGLLSSVFHDPWHRAELIPTLWYMIGTFQIGIDLRIPISMDSTIWDISPIYVENDCIRYLRMYNKRIVHSSERHDG